MSTCSARERIKPTASFPRQFTWQELSSLNERHNAHVAVRGKVYDVSSFVSRHPGGADQILLGAGRDVTQLFESYHSSETPNKVLEQFYVGELVTNELPVFPKTGKFYKTLQQRVNTYFKENNLDPKVDYWMFFMYFLFFFLALASWYCWILYSSSWILGITFAVCWGFTSSLVVMTILHDASHFAITHKPWVWKVLCAASGDFYWGGSSFVWKHQHVVGHHQYTNIDWADPDIVTATTGDLRRIKASQTWLARYANQHLYIPFVYFLINTKVRVRDFFNYCNMRNATIRFNKLSLTDKLIFWGGKTSFTLIFFVIPSLFVPIHHVLFYNLVAELFSGYWLSFMFQTAHVVSEVKWPTTDENKYVDMDWAEMQVATTQDYSTDNWLWSLLAGALNHQVAHHLFPGVVQSHYPKITPIIRQTCEEFGVKYNHVESPQRAIACHFNHLRRLGQPDTTTSVT